MPGPNKPFRVLFVCMGNICRSPAADVVMRELVARQRLNDQIEVDSAGTIGYHRGNGPDPRMAATLARRGYLPTGSARQVVVGDFDEFDLVLAMDDDNLRDLNELTRLPEHREKIRRFTEFCRHHQASAVPDPYYGGDDGFEDVADLIEDGAHGLLAWISERLPG
jgi:protein-tyrosine phosphatase